MNKPPAFQFYPQDYLSSSRVAEMTLEEEGAYIRLLCYCWTTGSIPSDPHRCAKLAGKGCSVETATSVQRAFNVCSTDVQRMVHDRLEKERENQKIRREQASKAGKKSGESRSKQSKIPAKACGSNGRSTDVQLNGNTSSSSSDEDERDLKPNRIVFQMPAIDDVVQYAREKKIDIDAESFWNFYDSKGWMVGKNKMKNWRSCVSGWAARNQPKPVKKKSVIPDTKEEWEAIFIRDMHKRSDEP